jgi:hypothetical protein
MAILVKYQIPPEETVFQHLSGLLNLVGLNLRNIDCPVILGHALFNEGISNSGQERNFPKIGVEWINDRRNESIGLNYKNILVDTNLRADFLRYKAKLSENLRLSNNDIITEMIMATELESWSHQIESEVIISGYATGGSGRRTLRWIYEAVDSCLSPMLHDISSTYDVTTFLGETAEVNLMVEAYGMTVWGFEVPVRISQIKTTYRKNMLLNTKTISSEELRELEKLLFDNPLVSNNDNTTIGTDSSSSSSGTVNSNYSISNLFKEVKGKIRIKIGLETYGQG